MMNHPDFRAPGDYIIFKRRDKLEEGDDPAVVIFYATHDVLSGLFTFAGFDETEASSVYSPFAAVCGSIVLYPYLEIEKEKPKAIIGMFDVSARPYVSEHILSFAVPIKKFRTMVDNKEELPHHRFMEKGEEENKKTGEDLRFQYLRLTSFLILSFMTSLTSLFLTFSTREGFTE
jgi:hypothetical protein